MLKRLKAKDLGNNSTLPANFNHRDQPLSGVERLFKMQRSEATIITLASRSGRHKENSCVILYCVYVALQAALSS